MVVWISVVILIFLFIMQSFGTDKVGYSFAPILCIWFTFNAVVGTFNFCKHNPSVIKALNPWLIVNYFRRNGFDGWVSLGGMVLCITGTEALFADVGHFSVKSIQVSMSSVVYPAVILQSVTNAREAGLIQVDSVNKHGILLQVVQALTDINLIIKKAYISSDGVWFMDVFYASDYYGNKIRDQEVLSYIQKTIEDDALLTPAVRDSVGVMPSEDYTSIELSGTDRPGLLSEVCAVLTDLSCDVVNAEIWTHNARAAAVVNVTDSVTGRSIIDPQRLLSIKNLLRYVLKGNDEYQTAQMRLSPPGAHRGRRLHQIMLDDRDYEGTETVEHAREKYPRPCITVAHCSEKDYTVITMRSMDRPKLLFDIVCTLTDMKYVVFHGMVASDTMEAYQEFYIRDTDGCSIRSETERERVRQCLEAAIERRASEGLKLELRTDDRTGLLSETTRIFRENGLAIRRAEISTTNGKAINTFYVTDVKGNQVDPIIVDSIRQQIGPTILHAKHNSCISSKHSFETRMSSLLSSFFKRPKP